MGAQGVIGAAVALDGVNEPSSMNFRDYASTETSAFLERLTTAAEAAAQQAVQQLHAAASGEFGQLRADLASVRQQAEHLRQQVASLSVETGQLRAHPQDGSGRAAPALTQLDAAEAEAPTTRRMLDDLVDDLRAQLESAHAAIQTESARAYVLDVLLRDAQAIASSCRQQSDEANARADSAQSGMSTLRPQHQQVTALLAQSIDAFDALATAATLDELFTTLVEQVAVQFPRVVLFRRRGQCLEGEWATGLDGSVVPADLTVMMNGDSIIGTAGFQGAYQCATAGQLRQPHSLPGDLPAFAVAAPLVFEGETLAVLYADTRQQDKGEAQGAFAGVLAAHTNVLLSRLTQELKTACELREYARMLLHEAEEMFDADTREGRTGPDRLRRLRDTIDFGRQLYARRAALEGPGAAGLLEEETAALGDADPPTDFTDALCEAVDQVPVAPDSRASEP